MTASPLPRFSPIVARLRASGCVFAEQEAELLIEAARDAVELEQLVVRRVSGLPLEHVVGWAEFCGERITVGPGVFVPRRRTELLVEQALALAPDNPCIIELCCGSGAISAVLLTRLKGIRLYATDLDPIAVRCARENLPPDRVFEGDLFTPLPSELTGRADLVIANAPYVPAPALELLPPEARLHEPQIALDGGSDGLDVLRRVIAQAREWLAPGGSLIVQGSELQAGELAQIIARHGLSPSVVIRRDLDDATALIGTLNP